jgi:hypothetical protein
MRDLKMTLAMRLLFAAAPLLFVFATAACGGDGDESKSRPATAGQKTREVELVKAVKPNADRLVEALRKNDLTGARAAYEAYDAGWNGIEVYTNVRDRKLYNDIEVEIQAKIGDALASPQPNLAGLVPQAEAMARKYNEVIALSEKGPPLSPLFDDLATLRIVRADLRIVTAALNAGDAGKARTSFANFKKGYPNAQPLIKTRSETAEQEVSAALNAADAKIQQSNAADELKPLVATLTERYNFGVNLLNAAARNADLGKKSIADADLANLTALNEVQNQLKASFAAWNSDNYRLAASANTAALDAFQKVQPALAAKSSDAPLKTSIDNYTALTIAPADPTKAAAANKAAVEAVGIAQQVIAGQFWTDQKVKDHIAGLPKA